MRDVRIAQIYEGTNGIQALDLLGRKVVANGGAALRLFTRQIRQFASRPVSPMPANCSTPCSALKT